MGWLWRALGTTAWFVICVTANVEPTLVTLPTQPSDTSQSSSASDGQLNSTQINPQNSLLIGPPAKIWTTLQALPVKLDQHESIYRGVQINWEAEEVFPEDWVAIFQDEPVGPITKPSMEYFSYSGDGEVEDLSGIDAYPSEEPSSEMPPSVTSAGEWSASEASLEAEELLLDIPSSEAPTTEYSPLSQDDQNPPLFWGRPYAARGKLTSKLSAPRPSVEELALGGCVGVWVAYIREDMPIAINCIKSHPSWMWSNRDILGSRSIRSLILPGMHNAGSYDLENKVDAVTNWVICQDEDVLSQLLYGGRYLDLRVGFYPEKDEKLWINHNLVRWRPLKDVLLQINNFVSLSKDPIFVDFHRFPVGFNRPEAMPLLLKLINSTLGPKNFLLSSWGPHITLNQIWKLDQRIIISLANKTIVSHTDWLWPALPQAWANAQNPTDLRKYIDIQMTKRCVGERMWAGMLQMTPSLWDILLRGDLGVRGFTDMVAAPITRWLLQRWLHCANIIAVDYIRATNIVEVSIELNKNMESIVALVEENKKIISNKVKINFTDNALLDMGRASSDVEYIAQDKEFKPRTWRTTDSSKIETGSSVINNKINKFPVELQNNLNTRTQEDLDIHSDIEKINHFNPVL